jgi:quinol monooxygenase YgiN
MPVIVGLESLVDPTQSEDFVQIVGEMLSVTRSAEACQGVEVATDIDNGGRTLLIEHRKTLANREGYLAMRTKTDSSAKIGQMVTAAPTVTYTELQSV